MKLYRYMSREEFDKYLNGEKLINTKDYSKIGNHSSSTGFCFLNEITKFDIDTGEEKRSFEYDPFECYEFLMGVVSNELLVEFEVIDDTKINTSSGIYADPTWMLGIDGKIEIEEFCATEYDKNNLKATKVYKVKGAYCADFIEDGSYIDRM